MKDSAMEISGVLETKLLAQAAMRGISPEQLLSDWLAINDGHPIETLSLFHQAFQHNPTNMVISDAQLPDFPILHVNEAFEANTGYTEAEILGKNCRFLSRDDRDQPALAQIRHAITQRQGITTTLRNYRKDGSIFWNELHLAPIKNKAGVVTHYVGVQKDITHHKQALLALEESEARFRLMADTAPILIWTSKVDKQCDYFNQHWLTFTGRTMEQEMGEGWLEGVHPDDYQHCVTTYETAFDNCLPFRMEYRLLRYDGVYRWVLDEATPRYLPDGSFVGYIGGCIDITDQRLAHADLEKRVYERTQELFEVNQELTASEIRYHSLLESLPTAITTINRHGQITYANHHAEKLFRLKQSEIANRAFNDPQWHPNDLAGKPLPDDQHPFSQVLTSKKPIYGFQYAIQDGRGDIRVLSVSGVPLFDSGSDVDEVILAIEDISLRKKWENSIQESLQEEKRLNELKTHFISMISHEFRTPLSVIMASAELLRLQDGKLDREKRLARVERIVLQVKRLHEMLTEITQLYKTSSKEISLQLTWIDLPKLMIQLMDDLLTIYPQSPPIEIRLQGDHQPIQADEGLLYQTFMNLLTNAVKYSPNGGTILIVVSYYEAHLEVQVRDHGLGIPLEAQSHLFDLFYRAKNVSDIPGTGLGLVIAKQAAEAHGGEIGFESQPNQGTTFKVSLPLRVAAKAAKYHRK